MAEQTVLNVSLKDYKKKIDELRGSLLGLTKDSQEYANTAKEIKDMQDKLNEVMSVGKKDLDGVDGSYNSLVKTMAALKKEWRTMEIGTEEWKNLGMQIDDINNKLKDADASVGVFSRNVGDYQNAFGKAFETAIQGLGKGGGILSGTANQVKQLIPLVKSVNQTATAGLNGVKKALASTGIGALIVGVGLLIANFDKLQKLFKKDNPVEEATKGFEDLKKAIDAANQSLELDTELMEANGATTEQIRLKKIELIKAQMAETQAQLDNVRATIKQIEAHSAFRRWIRGEKKDLEDLKKAEEEMAEFEEKQRTEIDKLENSNTADRLKKKKDAIDEEKKKLDELLNRIRQNSKSELDVLTEKYKNERALLIKHHKDTEELDRQYILSRNKMISQTTDSLYARLGEYDPNTALGYSLFKTRLELENFQEAVNEKFPPDALIETKDVTEEMISKAKNLGLEVGNTAEDFSLAYRLAYQSYKKVNEEFTRLYFKQTDAYREAEKNLKSIPEDTEQWYMASLNMTTSVVDSINKVIDEQKKKLKEILEQYYAALNSGDEEGAKKSLDRIKISVQSIKDWEDALYEADKELDAAETNLNNFIKSQEDLAAATERTKTMLQQEIKILEAETSLFGDKNLYKARLEAAKWYADNLEEIENETNEERKLRELKAQEEIHNIQKEYLSKRVSLNQSFLSSLSNAYASYNDYQEQLLRDKYKNDKDIDRKVFEEMKNSRISQAKIDTLQGAIAAFMGYQELPQPYGLIIGAIQAAAVTAAGLAQIQQIKNTSYGNSSGNGEITASNRTVNVTPRVADYQPERVSNLTGASEVDNLKNAMEGVNLWVSVTDINAQQTKVTQRNREASF